jgi:hypothetical protein
MLKRFVIQLTLLISISSLIAFLLNSLGVNMVIGFLSGLFLQFVGYNAFYSALDAYLAIKNKALENERIKEFSYQGLEVACPCYKKHIDFVPVRLNTSNYYKCGECKKNVSVIIAAETAITTEPIVNTDLPVVNEKLMESVISNANS